MRDDLMQALNEFLNFNWSDVNKIMFDNGLVLRENSRIQGHKYSMPDYERIPNEVYSEIYSNVRPFLEPFGMGRYRDSTEIRCSNSTIFNSEQTWHGIKVGLVNGVCNITGDSALCLLFSGEEDSIIISIEFLKELIDLIGSENI